MALLNPVYGLVVPFLCVFTIPLAIFAGLTTTLAFSVLMVRVAVVYVNLALRMVPQYFAGQNSLLLPAGPHHLDSRRGSKFSDFPVGSFRRGSGSSNSSPTQTMTPGSHFITQAFRSPRHRSSASIHTLPHASAYAAYERRSRRSSQVSMVSVGTITPIQEDATTPALATSGLMPSTGLDRDFEGVGGWRLDERGDDADWFKINSRLELPTERAPTRHHSRSQSGGPTTPADGCYLTMKSPRRETEEREWERRHSRESNSPNSSRVRTAQGISVPSALTSLDKEREDEYFPHMTSPKTLRKYAPQSS